MWNFLIEIISYINPFSENFFGIKLVEFFGDLLKKLFVPSDTYFSDLQTEFKELLKEKIPYEAYIELFENLKDVTEGDPSGLNVNFNNYQIGNQKISTGENWVKFDIVLKYKQTWFQWCRGFTYIFFIIYNINQFIKLINKGAGVAVQGVQSLSGGVKE